MIIKFREERITRLEQKQALNPDEKDTFIKQLKAENHQIKDQIEHNPVCAKLFAENAELQRQIQANENENSEKCQNNLTSQIRSQRELMENL
jgi:hypothetical protein